MTNEELARCYAKISAYTGRRKKSISTATQSIFDYYHKHGNLENLQIEGVGPTTKHVLEIILEHGPSKAPIVIEEEQQLQLRRSRTFDSSRFIADDDEEQNCVD